MQTFIPKPTATGKHGKGDHAEHAIYLTATGKRLFWSASFPLPEINDEVVITMNNIGPAVVRGYFSEHGYLGVMTYATNPPQWLRDQRKGERSDAPQWIKDGIGCEFGAEIDLPAEQMNTFKTSEACAS